MMYVITPLKHNFALWTTILQEIHKVFYCLTKAKPKKLINYINVTALTRLQNRTAYFAPLFTYS